MNARLEKKLFKNGEPIRLAVQKQEHVCIYYNIKYGKPTYDVVIECLCKGDEPGTVQYGEGLRFLDWTVEQFTFENLVEAVKRTKAHIIASGKQPYFN